MAKVVKDTEAVEQREPKEKRMKKFLDKMEKNFGAGSVIGLNDKSSIHEFVSTGSIGLDKALGIGGLPRGRIVEIYGPESSGKTTICMHVMKEALRANPEAYCGFIDVEQAFDKSYADKMGLDSNRIKISQPDYGEEALEIARQYVDSGEFDVVIVDCVAALVP